MYSCFKCCQSFSHTDELIDHLKISHLLKKPTIDNPLICKFKSCDQLFFKYAVFKKHICNSHAEITLSENDNIEEINIIEINNTYVTAASNRDSSVALKNNLAHIKTTDYQNNFEDKSFFFSCGLHARPGLPRNEILFIQKQIADLLAPIASAVKDALTSSTLSYEILNYVLDFCKSPFKPIVSEYKFLKFLKEKNLYENPLAYTISNKLVPKIKRGKAELMPHKVNIQLMPVKFQITKFFEIPDVLNLTVKNQKELMKKETICNFVNTCTFANKLSHYDINDIIIPLNFYADEFQINNAIGAHVSSICGCYYCLNTCNLS